jgi:hypothetical protein
MQQQKQQQAFVLTARDGRTDCNIRKAGKTIWMIKEVMRPVVFLFFLFMLLFYFFFGVGIGFV